MAVAPEVFQQPVPQAESSEAKLPLAPLDPFTASYQLDAATPEGDVFNIPCSNLAWEEEQWPAIATRINADLPDARLEDGRQLTDLVKLGTNIAIRAAIGSEIAYEEVVRGIVEEVTPSDGSSGTFSIVAYDSVHALLKNQVNLFIKPGQTAAAAIGTILDDWKVPYGEIASALTGVTIAEPGIVCVTATRWRTSSSSC